MKFKNNNNSLRDETNSLTYASTESRSMILGEEAGSNAMDLYYENQKNLLKTHFEQKKYQKSAGSQRSRMKSFKSDGITKKELIPTLTFPKTAPPRLEKQKPNLLKEVSALNISSLRNSSIRYSAREKLIMDWAFKRFDDAELDLIKPNDKKRKKKTRFDHEFWYEKDQDILQGADINKHISLNDTEDNKNDLDYYRTNRNKALASKNDIELNRQTKQLDSKLIDLSKERYKVLGILDYEKKKFVRHQLLKSESLPGLRCIALMNENPDYKFKRPGKVITFEKFHKNLEEKLNISEPPPLILPDINFPQPLTDSSFEKTTNQKIYSKAKNNNEDDKKLLRSLTTSVIISSQIDVMTKTDNNTDIIRPKSEKTKNKQNKSNDNSLIKFDSSSSMKNESSEFKSVSAFDEATNKVKKSILKQPNTVRVSSDQKSIIFDEKTTKRVKTAKSRDGNQTKETTIGSLDIMMGVLEINPDEESLNSFASFNLADTNITNDVITNINEQTLTANIKLVNEFKELEERSYEVIDTNENMDGLVASFINARSKNVSSLSEPNTKLAEANEESTQQIMQRSIDDSTINLKTKDSNHKVSFKLASESNTNINNKTVRYMKPIRSRSIKPEIKNEIQQNEKIELIMNNSKNKTANNNFPIKPIKSFNIEATKTKDLNLKSASNASFQKMSVYTTETSYANINISPIQDNRFRDLISIVKPSYIVKEIKDVKKIIEKNDALKSINIDFETREKMSKVKERGSKLAVKARQILASGEYSFPV